MKDVQSIISSFDLQEKLNPEIWSSKDGHYTMIPKVRYHLLEIANDFIDSLNVDVIVSDILMTGSLANYNWSNYSDVDIHIVVDYNQFPKNVHNLYDELFRVKKTIYSTKHDITIFGYDVELYVENESEKRDKKNVGIYSLLINEWIIEPNKENVKINIDTIKKKANQWMNTIDNVVDDVEGEDIDTAKKIIEKYTTKLRKFRQSGIDKGGEYSDENLVFKLLRRNGYLEKLRGLKHEIVDKQFSLKESVIKNKHF